LHRLARAHIALLAASASLKRARASSPAAVAVAKNAAYMLFAEAEQNLGAIPSAEQDAEGDASITDALYAAGRMPEPGACPVA